MGFALARYEIRGRNYTAERDILQALSVERGTPILGIDLGAAAERIERLPWVRSAIVRRSLPDALAIEIIERRAAALWRGDDADRLIDAEGRILTEVVRGTDVGLPVLSGEGAGPAAAGILNVLADNAWIAPRLQQAERIAGRRWSLHLVGGTVVHLPADGVGAALAWLASPAAHGLLESDLETIDLRVPGQLVVRRRPPARTAHLLDPPHQDFRPGGHRP
jgi:cell division protein FtsQ